MSGQPYVVAVVVTHNRRDLLVEALAAVTSQTRALDRVVVVDNASTDGTGETVRELSRDQPEIEVVTVTRNTGGAGGFAVGAARALDDGAELVWLMDDDTIPRADALEELLDARARFPDRRPPVLLASRVVWTDGNDHPMNTPRVKPRATQAELAAASVAGCLPIRSASFVSVLVDGDRVRDRGLPLADYFLWNDDFEFTTRILRDRDGLLCHASVAVHKTRTASSTDTDPGERFFYEVRNKVWLFTRSSCLAPGERVLYAGSTVRRWARTAVRSRDRAVLGRGFRRGLEAGLRAGPTPTGDVLAEPGLLAEPAEPAKWSLSAATDETAPPHATVTPCASEEG